MAKWLVTIGIVCVMLGIAWPLLNKLGLGRLPGDIRIEKQNSGFYFPITSSIIISIVLSVLFAIFRR
jgi:ABC-type phosphate transport system permease subunit